MTHIANGKLNFFFLFELKPMTRKIIEFNIKDKKIYIIIIILIGSVPPKNLSMSIKNNLDF